MGSKPSEGPRMVAAIWRDVVIWWDMMCCWAEGTETVFSSLSGVQWWVRRWITLQEMAKTRQI